MLADGSVFVEYGPMRLFIEASSDGKPRTNKAVSAARFSLDLLAETAAELNILKKPHRLIMAPPSGRIGAAMLEAVQLIGDEDLTPMAAVAGSISDAVADYLVSFGCTKVVVNNGGDLALRIKSPEMLVVGIRPDVNEPRVSGKITITENMECGGICTSGFGGRSFTKGIASAVTVFAQRASCADAAASAIANATLIKSATVVRREAESIDPSSDLKGSLVTYSVGDLSDKEEKTALIQGLHRAETLVSENKIIGAYICVKKERAATEGITPFIINM